MDEQRNISRLSDPSPLTTAALLREIESLKELVFSRLNAIETAIKVAHDDLVRVPTDVQRQVGNLRELHHEKFNSVEARFAERDKRFEQEAENSKMAVAAALVAVKESVAKSESGFAKQIEQLTELLHTSFKGLDEKNDDLKERMTRLEGKAEGTTATTATHHDSGRNTMQLIALIAAILLGMISLGVAITRGG